MQPAILNPALTAVETYPASIAAIQTLYPDMQRGTVEHDGSFSDHPRVVLVREDPDPALSYGQRIVQGPIEKRGDGRWYLTKQVVSPDAAGALAVRAELKRLAGEIAATKRQELTTAHIMTFMELDKIALDATPTAAEYPLIAAIALGRAAGGVPTTFAQAVTGAQNFRTNWLARAVVVERKYHEILARIDSASTLAAAKTIYDELEALV